MICNNNQISALPLFAYKHPIIIIIVFTLISMGAIYLTKQLKLDADLGALLPDSFESVQDLEKVKERFGGIGYVVVTIRGDNPPAMRLLADEIADKTKTLDHISFVDYRRPVDFFKDRALYYLETTDLTTIQKRIKKRWKWEKRKRNPMYVDLENSEAPSLSFDDIQDNYEAENSSSWMSAQQSEEAYYFNENKTFLAVFIKPNIQSSNLGVTETVLTNVTQVVNSIDITRFDPTLKIEITGRYKKKIDLQSEMKHDMGIASLVSLSLVLIYLLLHFKRIEALVLIAVPLIVGIVLTFAFAAIFFSQLNILTAFIGVILLGLGIDHGIHLLSRYRDEMKNGNNQADTIHHTFVNTGRSVLVAALTTFVIFLGLSFSNFRAFYEFGIIASAGIVLIMATYLLLMPALLSVINKTTWKFNSKSPKITKQKTLFNSLAQLHENHSTKILFFTIVIVFVSAFMMHQIKFNYDFESLGNSNLPSFKLDKEVNDLLGYSQTPMVALTENIDEEYFVSEKLRENQISLGNNSGIDFLLSSSDLIPINQEDKQLILKKILKTIKKVKDSWLDEDEKSKLEELKRTLQTNPFEYKDLPIEVKQLFGQQESISNKGAIMLFPSISLSDGDKVIQLSAELRQVNQKSGDRLIIAGESMILADILNLIFSEAPKILLISLFLIFSILWIFLKQYHHALVALVPAVFTIIFTLATMRILGFELNYINIIMIPIILGIGVDSGVHMVNRAIDGHQLNEIINETGMAIFGSIFTSGLGFAALLLTNHPGLNGLAYVAIIGLSYNLIISIFILPSLIQKFTVNKVVT